MEWRRLRVIACAAVLWELGGGGCCLPIVQGGEQVTFSDSSTPSAPLVVGPRQQRKVPFGGLLDRESSLSGVTAVPFSSIYAAPSAKTSARDREMLERRLNWAQMSPDDLALTEKNANEALGVRDGSLDDTEDRPKGDLARYVEKLDKEKAKEKADGADAKSREANGVDPRQPEAPGGFESITGLNGPGSTRPPSGFESVRFSDAGGPGNWSEAGRGSMIDLHLSGKPKGLGNALKSGTRQPSARNEAKIRLEAYQKIIDLPTSGGLPTGPLATTLPGALDPVNFHIDLTRQGLNPVVGEAGKSAAKPIVSESLLPRASFPLAGRAGELPVFDSKAGSPFSIAGSLAPLLEPPKPTPSPLRLEMPKRGFQ